MMLYSASSIHQGASAPHQSGLHHHALRAGLIDQKSVLDESTIRQKLLADIDHD